MVMALWAAAQPCQSAMQKTSQIPFISSKTSIPSSSSGATQPLAVKFRPFPRPESRCRGAVVRCYVRPLRPVEERFRIQVERNVDEGRLKELGVKRWSKWESGLCAYEHEWKVDEHVYIAKGSVRVTPEGCEDCAYFYAGDLVQFPKWFCATLSFDGEYEQRYRFLAYGDA